MSRAELGSDFVRSLARGLDVIQAFSADRPALTLSEVARLTDLPRATARRLLITLRHLGYVRADGREYSLTPQVLDLGYAYLSSMQLGETAQPHLEELVDRVHESSSVSVLDGHDIVYVVRVPTTRIMTISLGLGSRLPAAATSMGRVLLADLDAEELDDFLGGTSLPAHTDRTITDPDELRDELAVVAGQGWALVDQELEEGVRSVAAPLHNASGRVIAGMNISGHAGRVTLAEMRESYLPALLETAEQINRQLARR